MKTTHRAARLLVPLAVLFAVASAVAWAQTRNDEPAGALSALIAEVRQLRQAVEESSRQQGQIQGLSVYLPAQQSRLMQIGAQLDAVRTELAAASARSQEFANLLSGAQTEAGDDRTNHRGRRPAPGEIGRMDKYLLGVKSLDGLTQRCHRPPHHCHERSLLEEPPRDRPADAGTGAGDKHNQSLIGIIRGGDPAGRRSVEAIRSQILSRVFR